MTTNMNNNIFTIALIICLISITQFSFVQSSETPKSTNGSQLYEPFKHVEIEKHLIYIISASYVILFVFIKLATETEFNYCIFKCYKNCMDKNLLRRSSSCRRNCPKIFRSRHCTIHRTNLSNLFPESTFLVTVGIIVAGMIAAAGKISNEAFILHPDAVFNILLVPIIMSAAWNADKLTFYRNIGTILWFAIFGTVLNAAIIMPFLYYGSKSRWGVFSIINIDAIDAGMFAILICAVDPVAVLSVFESMHIDRTVYNVVFGESLLNDGVAVVFFKSFVELKAISNPNFYKSIGIMFSFFIYAFIISLILGVIMAILISYISKLFSHIQPIEFVVVFSLNYLTYLIGDAVKGSGIIALFFCVLIQRQYVIANLSYNSQLQVQNLLLQLGYLSEGIIFILMGITAFSENGLQNRTDVGFSFFLIFICYVSRLLVIFSLGFLANIFRRTKLSYKRALLIQAHGGLRGAIGFSLAYSLEESFANRYYYRSATAIMVFFSVYVLGVTIKPLVNFLRIPLESKDEVKVSERILEKVLERHKEGIKAIVDSSSIRLKWERFFTIFNNRYLKKWLMQPKAIERNISSSSVVKLARNYSISEAQEIASNHGSIIYKEYATNDMNTDARVRMYRKTWGSFSQFADTAASFQNPEKGRRRFHQEFYDGGCSVPDMQILEQRMTRRDVDDQMTHHNRQDGMGRKPPGKRHGSQYHIYKHGNASHPELRDIQDIEAQNDYRSHCFKQPHRVIDSKLKNNPDKFIKTFNHKRNTKSVKFNADDIHHRESLDDGEDQTKPKNEDRKPQFHLGDDVNLDEIDNDDDDDVCFQNEGYVDDELEINNPYNRPTRNRKRHVSVYDPILGISIPNEENIGTLPWHRTDEIEPEIDRRAQEYNNYNNNRSEAPAIVITDTTSPSATDQELDRPLFPILTDVDFKERHSETIFRCASPKLLRLSNRKHPGRHSRASSVTSIRSGISTKKEADKVIPKTLSLTMTPKKDNEPPEQEENSDCSLSP